MYMTDSDWIWSFSCLRLYKNSSRDRKSETFDNSEYLPVSELYFLMNGYGNIEYLHHGVMISSDCPSLVSLKLNGLFLWMMKAGGVISEDDFFIF